MNKKLMLGLTTVFFVVASHATVTFAQMSDDEGMRDHSEGMGMHDRGGMMGMGMRQMDQDGDGMISRNEFRQAHEKMFDAMDQDGDGMISQEEMHKGSGMMDGHMMQR